MALITLALLIYIALGWVLLLLRKWNSILFLIIIGIVFGLIANWLKIDKELLFLFSVGIGSMAYLNKFGLRHNAPFLLFLGTIGYYWYATSFIPALFIFLLASIGSIIVYVPLKIIPNEYKKISEITQISHGYIFSIIAFGNIILHYFLYGI
ncbi:MAG: hypothetical protein WC349_05310 [Patescibacteria group bacterium]|jgi:hypothetical protein